MFQCILNDQKISGNRFQEPSVEVIIRKSNRNKYKVKEKPAIYLPKHPGSLASWKLEYVGWKPLACIKKPVSEVTGELWTISVPTGLISKHYPAGVH